MLSSSRTINVLMSLWYHWTGCHSNMFLNSWVICIGLKLWHFRNFVILSVYCKCPKIKYFITAIFYVCFSALCYQIWAMLSQNYRYLFKCTIPASSVLLINISLTSDSFDILHHSAARARGDIVGYRKPCRTVFHIKWTNVCFLFSFWKLYVYFIYLTKMVTHISVILRFRCGKRHKLSSVVHHTK